MHEPINASNADAQPKKSNKILWIAGCGGCGCLLFLIAVVVGIVLMYQKW
ncbi:MAG TPA: hypothetical protein VKX17_26465 [Planctomycetota bacterium]|nr:hypothetical protein [Planctomycetota bacterium]